MDRNRFIPDDKGRIVATFLNNFFKRYVEYGFTADLEEKLDESFNNELDWKQLLRAISGAISPPPSAKENCASPR